MNKKVKYTDVIDAQLRDKILARELDAQLSARVTPIVKQYNSGLIAASEFIEMIVDLAIEV